MATTLSVSKGVFAFKRHCNESKHPKSKKSRQRSGQGQMPYWPVDDKRSSQQQKNFHSCWDSISDKLKKLENEMHQNVFKDLVSFVVSHSVSKCITSNSCNSKNVRHSIPAAILVTGINMPDSGTVLSSLEQLLLDEGAAGHIARLHSRDCANIKSCIVSLVSQLVNGTNSDRSDSDESSCLEEEEDGKKKSHRKSKLSIKKNNCTMAVLEAWHQEQGVAGSVVVMLEDVESFPTVVLQDLISIASQHCLLPLLLVLCCHTSPAALHARLTQPTLARLALTIFQGRPSHHYLATLVTEVLMDEKCSCFRLGGSTFKLLLDMFLCHHLTVNTFVQGLKYCALQHFLNNGSSVLCCPSSERSAVAAQLSSTQLNTIRKLASFRKYVESLPSQEKAPLLVNDDKFRHCCVSLLDRLDCYYTLLCCAVRALHLLAAAVPGAPLGRQVWSVLSLCLDSPLVESRGFEEVWRHLEGQARHELLEPMLSLVTLLKTSGLKEVQKVTSDLEEVMESMLLMDEEEVDEQNRPKPQEVKTVASPVKTLLPSDRFKLKEKLQELAKKNRTKPNRFQVLRSQYLSIVKEFLMEYAVPPSTQPLHEVTFFNNSSEVMHRLLGKHRTAVTKALGDPHHYFQCECCRNSNTDAPVGLGANSPLPDLSIAYRLHLECGRLINLYDWLQAFCACAEQETTTDDEDGGTEGQPGAIMQARFVQAVSELQFLGFIKTSKRKTDHVARLTWGGC